MPEIEPQPPLLPLPEPNMAEVRAVQIQATDITRQAAGNQTDEAGVVGQEALVLFSSWMKTQKKPTNKTL